MTAQAQLESALAEAAGALETGDAVRAAAAMGIAARACEEARTTGATLDAKSLAQARRLFDRCTAAATDLQARLGRELSQASLGRRAVTAYRPR